MVKQNAKQMRSKMGDLRLAQSGRVGDYLPIYIHVFNKHAVEAIDSARPVPVSLKSTILICKSPFAPEAGFAHSSRLADHMMDP